MPSCIGHGMSVVTRVRTFYVPSAGDLTAVPVVPQDAAVDFQGVGQLNETAEKVLEGSASFQGIGVLGDTGTRIVEGSISYQGVGLFTAALPSIVDASVSFQGVGLVTGDGQKVLQAVIAYQTSSLLGSSGAITYNGSVVFAVAAIIGLNPYRGWQDISGNDSTFAEGAESSINASPVDAAPIQVTEQQGMPVVPVGIGGAASAFTRVTRSPMNASDV